MDPCRLKFQVIQTNSSWVIAVGSWPENIINFCLLYLQFPVILTQTSNSNNSGTVCPNQLKFWQIKQKFDMRGITSAEKIYKIIVILPPLGVKSTQSQVFLPPHMSYFCPVQNWFSPFYSWIYQNKYLFWTPNVAWPVQSFVFHEFLPWPILCHEVSPTFIFSLTNMYI